MTPENGAMNGLICLVTGANRGIGKATAIGLARSGARVAIVSRDRGRGEAARNEIQNAAGNRSVELFLADLSSQESIRSLAAAVANRFPALHVLVNNAGIIMAERRLNADGHEMTFAVNHLAYFSLTHHLMDLLKKSVPARIVNVSSEAHRRAGLDPEDLQGEKRYRGLEAYANSKLANILFTHSLAKRLAGTGITVNCLHPGVIETGLLQDYVREMNRVIRWARPLLRPFFGDAETGAGCSLYLAASPELSGVTGKYFIRQREARSSRRSHDRVLADRLWEESCRLTAI